MKYGYSSHESFTRAFKAYHGITPTDCRKYSLFNFLDKINVKLAESKAGKGFVVIAEETKLISHGLTYGYEQIVNYMENMEKSNSIHEIRQWVNQTKEKIMSMDDFAFRVNILALLQS